MNILTSLFGKKRTIITRNPELMIWEVKSSGVKYSASISGIKLKLTKEAGTRESYGGKTLLARHFLGKEKWQSLVAEQFGDDIFKEIYSCLENAYDNYQSK